MKSIALTWLAGVLLALAAAALVLWFPGRGELMFTNLSSGANEVKVPFAYWLIAGIWMILVSRLSGVNVRELAPRAIVVAFATHVLVLLADFTAILRNDLEFTTPIYQLYARVFCAAALAAAIAGTIVLIGQFRAVTAALAAPVVVATLFLAAALLRVDPLPALAAIVVGVSLSRMKSLVMGAAASVRALLAGDRGFVVAIFLAALVLRMLYLQRVMSNPGYVETGADGPVYDELAWSIAQGRGIRASFTERFPLLLLGYVWFVSAIYKIAGHSYFAVGAVQALIGSAACVIFYRIARELFGQTVARTAAWFAVISFPLLFAAAAIGHQAIDVFLTALIVWLLIKTTADSPWWRWAVIGLLFGLAIAVRETVTFFLAFVIVWIPLLFVPRWSWRAVGAAAVLLISTMAALAPLVLPKISTAAERAKLRHHFDILYRGEADPIRLRDDLVAPLQDPSGALAQLRESPGLVLGTLGRAWANNFALQFFSQPYGGFDLIFLRKGTAYYYGLWFYAYALGAAGVAMLLRRLRADARAVAIVLVLGLIASRTIPHLILESNYRHRVPIEPFLILLASVAVVQLITAARRSPSAITT